MKRRVVVTGMGAITPIGNTVEEFLGALQSGRDGHGAVLLFLRSGGKKRVEKRKVV